MATPRISVIIPAYNAEAYLAEAIESVLRQGHPDLEVLVVNDGSTDRTADILAGFGDRITVVTQENGGLSNARNVGIAHATGDVIGFLDADDVWPDDHVSAQLPFLLDGAYDYVRGHVQYVRELGTPQEERSEPFYFPALVGACLYTASLVRRVGPFDGAVSHGEDADWHARIEELGGREKRLPRVALLYRRHTHNITNDIGAARAGIFGFVRNRLKRKRAASSHG